MKSKLKHYKVLVRRTEYKTFLVCGKDEEAAVKEAMYRAHCSTWEDVDSRGIIFHTIEEYDPEG